MSLPPVRYYFSKWSCPWHGKYTARTNVKVDDGNPVLCPECIPTFDEGLWGMTTQPVPYVSKPRIPQLTRVEPVASDKRPLRKRGRG